MNVILSKVIDRYLHGIAIKDSEYKRMLKVLFNLIKRQESKISLSHFLKSYIGDFNDMTAEIYCDLARMYLRTLTNEAIHEDEILTII